LIFELFVISGLVFSFNPVSLTQKILTKKITKKKYPERNLREINERINAYKTNIRYSIIKKSIFY
jgi:hypothetical protein